jgi:predicted DNA-binding transcriptional regulator YafY
MTRTLRSIRRSIRAALNAGRQLVTAVRGHRFATLVRLFAAIDAGATVRIAYTDSKGVASVRDITPRRLDPTAAGNITCRAYDWRDGEDTTFRTDRITLDTEQETPAMPVTLTKTAVTLHDIQTGTVWRRMSHRDGEYEIRLCYGLGDTVQEYDTTDRAGNPLRVVLQFDATGPYAGTDQGGIYEFAS